MAGIFGPSLGLFGIVWAVMCLTACALVTDAMLKDARTRPPARGHGEAALENGQATRPG